MHAHLRRRFVIITLLHATAGAVLGATPINLSGDWDITVEPAGKKIPCWIGITRTESGWAGTFCSEVAGVYPIGPVELQGDTIRFRSRDWYVAEESWYEYEGTVEGDTIQGQRRYKGKTQPWIARRFIPKLNVTGAWHLKLATEDGPRNVLVDLDQNEHQITGTWQPKGESAIPITRARLDGEILSLDLGNDSPHTARLHIKGDRVEGQLHGAQHKPIAITGTRQRQWGKPISLFNGKDLTGWETRGFWPDSFWTVKDGLLMTEKRSDYIQTIRQFDDFKLHIEFKVPKEGNAGVYVRARYEVQILDSFGHDPLTASDCGAIYSRIVPATNASKPPREWQAFDITLISQYITVVYNGVTVVDNQRLDGMTGGAIASDQHRPGPLMLQGDHSAIAFRNIVLTPARTD